jgi:hypothetical protein
MDPTFRLSADFRAGHPEYPGCAETQWQWACDSDQTCPGGHSGRSPNAVAIAIAAAASRISPMKASDGPLRARFFFDRGAPPVAAPPVFCRFVRFRFFGMGPF